MPGKADSMPKGLPYRIHREYVSADCKHQQQYSSAAQKYRSSYTIVCSPQNAHLQALLAALENVNVNAVVQRTFHAGQ